MRIIIASLFATALSASTITTVNVSTLYASGAILDECNQSDSSEVRCQTNFVGALAKVADGSISLSGYSILAGSYLAKATSMTTLGWTIDVPRAETVIGVYSLLFSVGEIGASGSITVIQDGVQKRQYFGNSGQGQLVTISVNSPYVPGTLLIQSMGLSGEIRSPGDAFLTARVGFMGFYDTLGNALNSVDPPIPNPEPAMMPLVGTVLSAILFVRSASNVRRFRELIHLVRFKG